MNRQELAVLLDQIGWDTFYWDYVDGYEGNDFFNEKERIRIMMEYLEDLGFVKSVIENMEEFVEKNDDDPDLTEELNAMKMALEGLHSYYTEITGHTLSSSRKHSGLFMKMRRGLKRLTDRR